MTSFDTICFGGEDWWYHNRAHIDMQLMRRFATAGKTLYVNSIVMQKPSLKKSTAGGRSLPQKIVRKTGSILRGLQLSDAGFWVYSPLSLPVQHIPSLRKVNETMMRFQLSRAIRRIGIKDPVVWVACPVASNLATAMPHYKLVYQRTDRFEDYPNIDTETVRQCDIDLKASADLTIFVSRKLYDEERSLCRKALYIDHGVDFDAFAGAQNDPDIPQEMTSIPRPVVGFFGGIDNHTSDIDLIEKVVRLLPDMSFVFIGKASADCSGFEFCRNVWMLGQRPYEQIPHYGKCFDVAIMPWQQNKWIEACNPIKFKEYLALGKPVVTTPYAQLHGRDALAYQANTPEDFAEQIRRAIAEDNPDRIRARQEEVRSATWDSRAQEVLNELHIDENAPKT